MRPNISAIRFEQEYLDELIKEENSCVEVKEHTYHLALHPFHLTNINESIKDILNKGIAKYDKKLDGILLGYNNIKLLSESGAVANDSFFIHVNIIASFYIFKPQIGKVLHGIVNKKSEDHVGCLIHKTFNVSLPKPEDDDWIGLKAEIGNEIMFCISFINLEGRLPYIRAEFMSIVSEEDNGFSTSEETASNKRQKKPKKIKFDSDDEQEVELNESETKKKKKKHKRNNDEEEDVKEEIKKRKRKHSTNNEEEIEENDVEKHTKKRRRKSDESIEELNTTREKKLKRKHISEKAEYDTNFESNKNKQKHRHVSSEEINENGIESGKEKKKSKKYKQNNVESFNLQNESSEVSPKKHKKHKRNDSDKSLEKLTNEVLQRTLLSFSEDTKNEKKKHKKDKNKSNEWDDELNTSLPELNLNSLFEESHKNELAASDNFVMADNEDKNNTKRRSSSAIADSSIENTIDLLADSDLERVCKDVEQSDYKRHSDKKSSKKRRKSTSSDEFEMPKKKVKKYNGNFK